MTHDNGPEPRSLGGTDIAAVLGMSKWKSPLDVWLKCRGMLEPRDPDEVLPDRLEIGTEFEDGVFQIFRKRTDGIIAYCSPGDEEMIGFGSDSYNQLAEKPDDPHAHHAYRLQSCEYPWLGGTPDRLIVRDGRREGYEGKTTSEYMINDWGPAGTDRVPADVLFQCHGYMILTELPRWHVGVTFGNQEFRKYIIKADPELHEMITIECSRFWRLNVLGGEQPPVDGSESCRRFLMKKHPSALEAHRDATEAEIARAEAWRELKAKAKDMDVKIKEHQAALMEAIGDAAGLVLPSGKRINWTERKGSTSWKGIAQELAGDRDLDDLIERYRGAPSRPLMPPRNW